MKHILRKLIICGLVLSALAWGGADTTLDAQTGLQFSETWVTAPSGAKLYARILRPVQGEKFSAVVLVPGGLGVVGAPMADRSEYQRLAAEGFVVVTFNAEGRGDGRPGNLKSEGTEDCNGFRHQDGLKAVIEYVASLSFVNRDNIGVATFSYGITMGAGALGRYPTLPIKYLIDEEGPHDSRVTAFQEAGRPIVFCGHRDLVTDPSPQNQAWWAEREAVRFIGKFRGAYMRVQAECDHVQPCGFFRHALEMNNAAIQGGVPWARINGNDMQNPVNKIYSLNDPSGYPKWIPGRLRQQPGGTDGVVARYIREIASAAPPKTLESQSQTRTIYSHVVLNVNYWDDESNLQEGIAAIKRHIALMQKYGIKADYYFTWLAAKQLMRAAPEIFMQLQQTGMGIHHHGANRDPKPQPVQRAKGQNWEEDVKAIREYETHDIDPKTGQLLPGIGGLKGMIELYKLPLFSTGRWVKAPILYVTKEFGLKMGVGLTENVGAPRPDAWYLGMLNRPDGPTLTPGDELVPWALTGRGDPISQLEKEIAQIPPDQFQVVALLMHDTDFVNHPSQAREKIWTAYEKVIQWAVSKLKPATAREFYAMVRSDIERSFSKEQIAQAAEQIIRASESSGTPPLYVDLGGDYLGLIDAFQALTNSLMSYASSKTLPREVKVRDLLGPTEEFRSDFPARQAAVPLPIATVEQALTAASTLQISDRVPARIAVAGRTINPAEWLYLAAKAYLKLATGEADDSISLFAVSLYAPQVQANSKADKLTKLQFWTFKPARWK